MSVGLRLVLASANPDKAAEIAGILGVVPGVVLLPRPSGLPEVEENGATLLENARLKAQALAEATGESAVADDTGLEVEALGGAPGVLSARFAGERATYADNVQKVLSDLAHAEALTPRDRRARFRTVALARTPRGAEVWAEGVVSGTIVPRPRGALGFGYDPVFAPDEGDGRTFAEMTADEKSRVSHRGRALAQLIDQLGFLAG